MVGRIVAGGCLMVEVLCGLTLAGGCGGQRTHSASLDVTGDVRAAPRRTLDTTGESGAQEAKLADRQGKDRSHGPDCVVTAVLDERCTKNTECDSGWCVLHLGEKVCTQACLEECMEGWACAEVAGAGSDLVFACLSLFPSLCLPCDSSSKCSSQDRCAAYPEGAGGFCATPCGDGSDCPCGYECTSLPTMEGDTKKLCTATGFDCGCTQHAVLNKLGTTCTVTNDYGSCAGWRECSADGLTSCTAPQPAVEVCDGQDNDCDGATDEEDVCDDCLCGDGACGVSGCGECWYNCTGADGESCCTCAVDCAVCGNGTCDPGEGPTKCAVDCCGACGDGICKGGECGEDAKGSGGYCAVDCAEPTCGNGVCEPGEDDDAADDGIADCPEDCGKYACGNGVCEPGENPQECPEDCASGCGDCQCAGGESYLTCPVDCGYCGDGYCIKKCSYIPEDVSLCPLDCACEPDCADKECGPDGCGGSCGKCGDQDPCTQDLCMADAGSCMFPPVDCDDGSTCTTDGCDPEVGCTHEDLDCDDGNACTLDGCDAGTGCFYGQVECDDADPCTLDGCEPEEGCTHSPIDCADEDLCTVDGCDPVSGCVYTPTDCDDGNPCTDDSCAPGIGCLHENNAASCDDENACTVGDVCLDGFCVGTDSLECDDGNPCTEDICKPLEGCIFEPLVSKCDDGDACTVGDHCEEGKCLPTGSVDCADENPCTDDSCDPLSGCVNSWNEAPCDDGDPCTFNDHCFAGSCAGTDPCGLCDPACQESVVGGDEEEGFDTESEDVDEVAVDDDGYLTLASAEVELSYLWVANSGENTVSKIDTDSGKEAGRYAVCGNPSRTAVDLDANVWVACRSDGGVAKIAAHEYECEDANTNGSIETSRDLDQDGSISADEILPEGEDECLRFIVYPGGSCQRALGIDAENHPWVGEWNGSVLRRLKPENGSVVKEIGISANPYGLVIDQSGMIWVSGRGGNQLVKVDPDAGQVGSFSSNIGCFEPYGISVDYKGRIWMGNCCCSHVAYRFDPSDNSWAAAGTSARPRGITGASDGFVYVANDVSSRVAKVNSDTMQTVGYAELGGGRFPVGVSVDFNGFVWAVNHSASSVSKVNPTNMSVVLEHSVGSNPYTYSDMTGYALKNYTAKQGHYRQVFEGAAEGQTLWSLLVAEAEFPGDSTIDIQVRSAAEKADLEGLPWSAPLGPFPPAMFPVDLAAIPDLDKKYLDVKVTLYLDPDGNAPLVKSLAAQFWVQE